MLVLYCNRNNVWDKCDIDSGSSGDCSNNQIPDECEPDSDGDGVIDLCDSCLDSNSSVTIRIHGCETTVANIALGDGCWMLDVPDQCAWDPKNHGQYMECVRHMVNDWTRVRLISEREKGMIQRCAAQAGAGDRRDQIGGFIQRPPKK